MRFVKGSSLQEYVDWYLRRDEVRHPTQLIPCEPDERVQIMRDRHSGKMRPWFGDRTQWHVVELDAEDLGNLVFERS